MTDRQANVNIYWAWKSMKQRCQNPRCAPYNNYGGRGICVCDEWQQFEPFLEWCLENGYEKGLDLDRIDNNGNYEPRNCRWTSRKENSNNTRFTSHVTVNGERKCATEWEEMYDLRPGLVSYWIRKHGEEYAAKRILEVSENGYTLGDYGYSHRKQVRDENGVVYNSTRECAKAHGIAPCTISNAIRDNRRTRKGRFEYI